MSDMAVELKRRPISVSDYHLMVEAGVFRPDERVELVRGELIEMPPIGRSHRAGTNRLTRLFFERFNGRAVVQVQCSVVVSDDSEPQPDFALLRWDPTGYEGRDPGPDDTFLLVEVGVSSRRFDREVKVPLYAETRIPEVWLVDLVERAVFIFRDPVADSYTTTIVATRGDVVACAAFPEDPIPVDEIIL
jgi:Uma2 family endonuclease